MTTDNANVVQAEPASTMEQTSTTAEPTAPQPLTEDKVQQMIAAAVERAVTEARELGRRELQSQQDRNRELGTKASSAERRAQLAEGTLTAARQRYQTVDPEIAKDLELEELRAKERGRMTFEQEEAVRQQLEAQGKSMQASLFAHLEALGIDPKDKRVDWAEDTADPIQGRSRFDASIAKVVKENAQTAQSGLEKRLRDLEALVNKANIEANSVETTTSQGVVAGSDAEFVKQFGSGELPMTTVNIERYGKIVKSY